MSKWTGFTPSFDRVARMLGIPLSAAVDRMTESTCKGVGRGTLLGNEAISLVIERGWHDLGRPSYRLTPELGHALMRTRLDFEAKFVRFPHAAFALEIPPQIDVRGARGGRLRGLLVGGVRDRGIHNGVQPGHSFRLEAPDGKDEWKFMVLQDWELEETTCIMLLTLGPDTVIAERLERVLSETVPDAGTAPLQVEAHRKARREYGGDFSGLDGSITNDTAMETIISLAIGSAMFAVSANARWARPIPPSKKKVSARKQRNRAPEPKRWLLGADIVLPGSCPVGEAGGDEDDDKRSLTWAHLRQGHLRMTRCGPVDDRCYELKYVSPTIVRPDLPLAPKATRHLMPQPKG